MTQAWHGIVTNTVTSREQHVRMALRRIGLKQYFDVILTSVDVGYEKPDEKIFLKALEALDVQSEEAVMVGNRVSMDIIGANRIGMKTILFRFKFETSKYDPHERNVKQIVLSFEGYGTAPAGNGVTVKVWNHVTSAWENPATGTGGADETITITLASILTDYIDMDSDGVGYLYVLARTTNPSDGTTAAVLHCDYDKCVLTVEGMTHVKFGTYRDVDETSVKPFLWHSEFMVIGWMFENVPET